MCKLLPANLLLTKQKISNFTPEHKAIKAKSDARALALMKMLAAQHITCDPDLNKYPHLKAAINERKSRT